MFDKIIKLLRPKTTQDFVLIGIFWFLLCVMDFLDKDYFWSILALAVCGLCFYEADRIYHKGEDN
jgi:hypothetical protein